MTTRLEVPSYVVTNSWSTLILYYFIPLSIYSVVTVTSRGEETFWSGTEEGLTLSEREGGGGDSRCVLLAS